MPPYNPGVLDNNRPEVFADHISQEEWKAKIAKFNAALKDFRSLGDQCRTAALCLNFNVFSCLCSLYGSEYSLYDFMTLYIPSICLSYFDEEGEAFSGFCGACINSDGTSRLCGSCIPVEYTCGCAPNLQRAKAKTFLQPLCRQLSTDKLIFSVDWADDDPDPNALTFVNRAGYPVLVGNPAAKGLAPNLYCGRALDKGPPEPNSSSSNSSTSSYIATGTAATTAATTTAAAGTAAAGTARCGPTSGPQCPHCQGLVVEENNEDRRVLVGSAVSSPSSSSSLTPTLKVAPCNLQMPQTLELTVRLRNPVSNPALFPTCNFLGDLLAGINYVPPNVFCPNAHTLEFHTGVKECSSGPLCKRYLPSDLNSGSELPYFVCNTCSYSLCTACYRLRDWLGEDYVQQEVGPSTIALTGPMVSILVDPNPNPNFDPLQVPDLPAPVVQGDCSPSGTGPSGAEAEAEETLDGEWRVEWLNDGVIAGPKSPHEFFVRNGEFENFNQGSVSYVHKGDYRMYTLKKYQDVSQASYNFELDNDYGKKPPEMCRGTRKVAKVERNKGGTISSLIWVSDLDPPHLSVSRWTSLRVVGGGGAPPSSANTNTNTTTTTTTTAAAVVFTINSPLDGPPNASNAI